MPTNSSNNGIQRVVMIVAMQEEADPFIQTHGLQKMTPSPFLDGMPMICYTGTVSSIEVFLVWTGRDKRYKVNNVATTAASVATYAAYAAFRPDLILSAGTAGGFGAVGAVVGDVYLSTKCVYHNRRIPSSGSSDYEEYGFGHFRSPPLPLLAAKCGLKMGVVSTSDSLDFSPIDLELMRGEGTSVKEMEAAAIAWVCQQVGVPFVAIKSITDVVDGSESVESEFYANLKAASESLQNKLGLILALLSTEPLIYWSTMEGVVVAVEEAPAVPPKKQKSVVEAVESGNKNDYNNYNWEHTHSTSSHSSYWALYQNAVSALTIAVAAMSVGYALASRKK
jgi:5'-methylthioadenosine nucleosidase